MNYQQTSAMAYMTVAPHLGSRQQTVYDEICHYEDITNTELSQILGWEINKITPRVLEIRKLCLVEDNGTRKCRVSGKTVLCWRKKRTTLFN